MITYSAIARDEPVRKTFYTYERFLAHILFIVCLFNEKYLINTVSLGEK